jgi:hypothetical protein
VKDRDIDEILKRAAEGAQDVDPDLLDRVSNSMRASLRPVRPMPAPWVLASVLALICVAVALAGAMLLKPYGIQKMNALEIGLIFPVLGILICFASVLCVSEVIPGSRRPMAPWLLCVAGCLGLAAVFALLFSDYGTGHFVSQGMKCLTAGVLHALPVSVASWWVLSRGFAVNSAAAGLAKGTLAGLAGVTMLELHCPNFEAPHVMVWHIAVVAISGVAGALLGWTVRVAIARP